MPRFDPETIAALAEGRLSPEEAARVEAAIAQDPAALADLEMQRTAIAALSEAPELHLTELERSGLRAAVAEAIGIASAPEESAVAPRRVPWGSLGIAAAALIGLVAVVPVVGLLNTGGGDDADTALADVATTSRLAPESAAVAEAGDAADETTTDLTGDGSFDAGEEAPGEELLGFGSTTTAPARATTTIDDTAAVAEETTTTTQVATGSTEPTTEAQLDDLLADLGALWEDPEAIEAVAAQALEEDACWVEDTESRGEDQVDLWTFEYTDEEQTVVVYFEYDSEGIPGPFTVYEPAECAAIAEIPEAP